MLDRIALAATAALLMAAPVRAQDQMSKETGMAHHTAPVGHLTAAPGHKATGELTLRPNAVVFAKDFSVEHSADAYVVLSNSPKVMAGKALYLGKIVQFSGAQSYGVPAGTDLTRYTHVVLWDKRAGTEIASAALPHSAMQSETMDHGAMKKDDMKDGTMDGMKKDAMKKPEPAMPKPN